MRNGNNIDTSGSLEGGMQAISRDTKDEELEDKLRELREEKTRMSQAYISGRIPQDVYKKAVIKVESEIANLQKEIRRRATGK
jgi:hypothetical protein